MKKVGITGCIGSGKSFICQIIQSFGYPIYDSDSKAKQLMNESDILKDEIIAHFGNESFIDGSLNRSYIAECIFHNELEREWINKLIHPAVISDFSKWSLEQNSELVFCESAILFESGLSDLMEHVIIVSAPKEICMNRAMKRECITKQHFNSRYSSQNLHKGKEGEYITTIINDNVQPLLPQLWELFTLLKS